MPLFENSLGFFFIFRISTFDLYYTQGTFQANVPIIGSASTRKLTYFVTQNKVSFKTVNSFYLCNPDQCTHMNLEGHKTRIK